MTDIAKMPHLLIAGATGSGKSVCINTLIMSILYKATPEEVKLIMIDPKVVELGVYNGIPHLLIPVVTEPKKAAAALAWAVQEMENRYKLFAKFGIRDIGSYNNYAYERGMEKMPRILVIIDELADLMIVSHVELVKGEGGSASAVEGLGVAAAHATGEKCERCWIYSTELGTDPAHPTLCPRCAAVLKNLPLGEQEGRAAE